MEHPTSNPEDESTYGVLSYSVENHHYTVSIRWADGECTKKVFPETKFPVNNRHLTGEEALAILKRVSGQVTRAEFAWEKYLPDPNHD